MGTYKGKDIICVNIKFKTKFIKKNKFVEFKLTFYISIKNF